MRTKRAVGVIVVAALGAALWALFGQSNGPEPGECGKNSGCINEQFFENADRHCASEGKCRVSMKEIAGDANHVYFIEQGSIFINECKTFRVPEGLRRSYTPWCQYILFEKGGEITGYVRASCTLDVERLPIAEDERFVSFDIHAGAHFATVMDSWEPLILERQGQTYFLHFSRRDIRPLKNEPCIGNVWNATAR